MSHEGYKTQKTRTTKKILRRFNTKYSHVSPKLKYYTEDPTSLSYLMGQAWHDMIAILLNMNAQQNSS